MAAVSHWARNAVSPYLIKPLQRVDKQSLKSFIENTTPGPEVNVSTSVHLFFNLVKNCWTKLTLVIMSRWEFLFTVSNNVEANYCYGLTNAFTWASVTPNSKHPKSPACCFEMTSIPHQHKIRSNSFLITTIWAQDIAHCSSEGRESKKFWSNPSIITFVIAFTIMFESPPVCFL